MFFPALLLSESARDMQTPPAEYKLGHLSRNRVFPAGRVTHRRIRQPDNNTPHRRQFARSKGEQVCVSHFRPDQNKRAPQEDAHALFAGATEDSTHQEMRQPRGSVRNARVARRCCYTIFGGPRRAAAGGSQRENLAAHTELFTNATSLARWRRELTLLTSSTAEQQDGGEFLTDRGGDICGKFTQLFSR